MGTRGERFAARLLERRGYHVLKLNWRCSKGEIDIIALKDRTLVFVEVKTRTRHELQAYGAQESIDDLKRERLRRLASWFIHTRRRDIKSLRIKEFRFDTIGITTSNILMLGAMFEHVEDGIGLS